MAIHIYRLAKKSSLVNETEKETAAVVCSGSVKAEPAKNTPAKALAKKQAAKTEAEKALAKAPVKN